ncbi:Carbamoyltransferase HypF2 [Rubrivivax sp. A210]|uniref:carbamoyltransferase HypF n=1 Tax=Rubrivivax sp. A210 TaxID=2772301 RepID=UPI00191A0F18|nr:carbamoyltransferase HypF [Rubrivivax sp. A210]CAD5375027.1 Carbamoyltransferase HypF2 [Rubrivivax sp. A210]
MQRCAIRVRGAVQGVGYRPFVYRLAQEMSLAGWVLNDAEGVAIEAEGAADTLKRFVQRLHSEAPPRARVEAVETSPCIALHSGGGFAIRPSRGGVVKTGVAPDMATCDDCLAELFDPADRRHRYAFINCTQCGPRYTITRALPYDRAQTSMAAFVQCPQCAAEYADPGHRRFHAEPNACPACGPALRLVDAQGRAIPGDPITATLALLRAGAIVAIKGLGGFHLACDARQPAAVAALRQRKAREEKPFAVMAANTASAARWVQADTTALALLAAPERPVVLLPMQPGAAEQIAGVAPGLAQLGLMLPSTPIQHLLFHEAAGRPAGRAWQDEAQELLLVMTSANPGGEPIVTANDDALLRLQGIADAVLLHDRDIVARCDDSVLRLTAAGAPQFIRRARGWTPRPLRLPRAGPAVLATGAWLKNTVCLTRGDEAFLSPHIGDLDNAASCAALEDAVAHLCRVLDVRPQAVAHDLHPDFHAARFAAAYAREHGLPAHAVQHHHAHIAAIAAEHGVTGPLLGLALDGVGLGSDGAAWGGELLRVDGGGFTRLGHLRPIALPGGDIAARQPWRLAAAVLHTLGRSDEIARRWAHHPAAATVARMLAQGLRCPPSSGMGRWFDAAAALLGVRELQAYEGQAPMLLEALAGQYAGAFDDDEAAALVAVDGSTLNPLPLLARLIDAPDAPQGAALFHHALAVALARWLRQAAESSGLDTVALGGGCFLNARLSRLLADRLPGLRVLQAGQAPPNDGGIALGQAWIAICREGEC